MKSRSNRYHGRPEQDRLIQAIQSARSKAGLSQRELSRRLGLHEMTIMRFENGERMLDVLELIDIAHTLDLSPHDLLRSALAEE